MEVAESSKWAKLGWVTGVRFTKQFGGKTAPKVCNKVTNFWGKFHPQTFCETHPCILNKANDEGG